MVEQLTEQQKMAVYDRGGKLLVAAAAGSGKTKVLVDRLMSYMTQGTDPANVDDFLIITYTKAAASELRGKIAAKLTEHIAAQPENTHLQRQLQRLYLAKISTVHSFCGDLLREYAYRLDLPADFRVADENECRQLRDTAMNRILDRAYGELGTDPDFLAFVDTQGLGRDDRLVPEILEKVYDSAQCHEDPGAWLEKCVRNAETAGQEDAAQTVWGEYLMADLRHYLNLQISALERCAELAEQTDTMEKPAALLCQTVRQLRFLAESETWDEVVQRQNIDYGRLNFSKKNPDPVLEAQIKAIREHCKEGLKKKLRSFADPSAVVLADMARSAAAIRGMVALARQFGEEYAKLKRSRRVLDFSDLEHKTLDLLLGAGRTGPTAAANEIEKRFREIMVDEYQDSNGVQDAIFSVLTDKRGNCFMVGDVKQSIYQFRLADPGIFLEKYNAYPDAENAVPGEGRKVLLTKNFRSGGAVLEAANHVFATCMSPNVGGLEYGPEEALREGIPHEPLGEPEVELLALEVQESTYKEEAELVASRICELLDGTHMIRGKEGLRPIRPDDIAILLRSPGSVGGAFTAALAGRGVRCVSGGGEDLLQTEEVSALRSLLQTVSNPRQDIPLIATLASPVFGFTANDLAQMRSGRRKSSVYDALLVWDTPKAKDFLAVLAEARRSARLLTLAELIETLLRQTGMERIYAAMPGGPGRTANLQAFYALAVEFEATGHRDLLQFLEFLEGMEEKGLVRAGEQTAAGAVTLMSIHKSKGLEFPVVFVSGLSREFNRESTRAQVLCHRELGLGLTAVDTVDRYRYPTLAKRAIARKTVSDSLSEEMRVLYVALTRARDLLVMTYAAKNLAKDIQDLSGRMALSHRELLTADVVCPGQWVLLAALRRTEAGELFAIGGHPGETTPGSPAWKIRVVTSAGEGNPMPEEETVWESGVTEETVERLRRGLAFRYGHTAATQAPSKRTATQLKGREKDTEAAEAAPPAPHGYTWRKPALGGGSGRDYGNAVHTAMQHLRFSACGDRESLEKEVARLIERGLLTPEEAASLPLAEILAFFTTDLGKKLRDGGQVLREFKFSILEDGEKFDPALVGEQVLLQGVVDCALVEDDGITVLDFKTDRVTAETLSQKADQYRSQVLAYANAMERIYKKPVKSALLYFFRLGEFVTVK